MDTDIPFCERIVAGKAVIARKILQGFLFHFYYKKYELQFR